MGRKSCPPFRKKSSNNSNAWIRKKFLNPFNAQQRNNKPAITTANIENKQQSPENEIIFDKSNNIYDSMINREINKNKNDDGNHENEISARKTKKLDRAKKYQMKKFKANQTRERKRNENKPTTIILESSSSEEDNDDVIEIKPPSPPTVTVYDSSDDSQEGFSHIANDSLTTIQDETSEFRCISPNSNISDDFIENADRFRLIQEENDTENMIENENALNKNDDGKSNEKNPSNPKNIENSNCNKDKDVFLSPQERTKKKKMNPKNDYQVTESNFRALDVYESESSDMPESVYAKGRTKGGPSRISSSSDIEEINDDDNAVTILKTKKLRKRKISSNRGSEVNDDFSTDSEVQENEDDQEMKKDENQENITSLPFISRGEAVENCKMKFNNNNRSKKRTKSLDKQPKNDNEFMNILKNIAQGGREEDDGNETDISNKSDDEEEDNENITARKIAEDVINRRLNNSNRTTAVDHVISTSVNENEENDNDKIQEEEDAIMQEIQNEDLIQEQAVEAAIPNISKKLDHFISIIDQLENDNKKLTNTNKNDITENVSLIEDSDTEESDDITRYEDDINEDEDSNNIDNKQQIIEEIKRINESDRDGKYLKVVYSNSSNHIGWNDEMIRFYDQSWGGENFSVPNIRRLMFNGINKIKYT